MTECAHIKTRRGIDVPRMYGSWRTEVCEGCGMFRRVDHFHKRATAWFPAGNYQRLVADVQAEMDAE